MWWSALFALFVGGVDSCRISARYVTHRTLRFRVKTPHCPRGYPHGVVQTRRRPGHGAHLPIAAPPSYRSRHAACEVGRLLTCALWGAVFSSTLQAHNTCMAAVPQGSRGQQAFDRPAPFVPVIAPAVALPWCACIITRTYSMTHACALRLHEAELGTHESASVHPLQCRLSAYFWTHRSTTSAPHHIRESRKSPPPLRCGIRPSAPRKRSRPRFQQTLLSVMGVPTLLDTCIKASASKHRGIGDGAPRRTAWADWFREASHMLELTAPLLPLPRPRLPHTTGPSSVAAWR